MTPWERRAEVLTCELSSLTAEVARELREPLAGAKELSRSFCEGYQARLDDRGRDYAARVCAAIERLGSQVDSLVRLGTAAAALATFDPAPLDVGLLARAIVNDLRARDPRRRVVVDIPEDVRAVGDPALVRTVLQEILTNAWQATVKSDPGRIQLHSRSAGPETVYAISDDGVGFDMAYARDLFQPFVRVGAANEQAGSGVGLAIARMILLRHGGRIWAEATPGRGATFFLTLPT